MSRFLHFIPSRDLDNTYHGTYKDVVSRIQWLQKHVSGYTQILIQGDDPFVVDTALAREGAAETVLIEYSHYPRILKRIRQQMPGAFIAVRAINIEPLQHLDNTGWRCNRGFLWVLYGMLRLFCHDLAVKRLADVILSINSWENRFYWSRLPGRARIEWLPYRCPDHLLPAQPLPNSERRIIACMPTSQKNRKSWDLVTRFQQFATEMRRLGSQDRFVITGKVQEWGLPECPEVTYAGFVDNLSDFMGSCRAVALLSPLGYGFKTTMGDAIAAGAHVLAHPVLARRCPDVVTQQLICVDSDEIDLDSVRQRLDIAPTGSVLHDELTKTAAAIMRRWFLRKKESR